jgi:L-fuculose-phosphate aldolase
VEVGRRLYQAGLVRGADGNFSAVLSQDEILITPSRAAKGFLQPEDLLVIDRQGRVKRGSQIPSLETAFHLAAYQERDDIGAVVHAHPPRTIAFTVAGKQIPSMVLPEFEILFPNGVPVIEYETPATDRLAEKLRPFLRDHDLVVLDHHGILSIGLDVYDSWMKVEHIEACMEILLLAESVGGIQPLPDNKLQELEEIRRKVLAARTSIPVVSDLMTGEASGRIS